MDKISQLGLVICTIFLSVVSSANAIEINDKYYCSLTIQQPDQSTFKILVPHDKITIISQQLNVVGLNCRDSNTN